MQIVLCGIHFLCIWQMSVSCIFQEPYNERRIERGKLFVTSIKVTSEPSAVYISENSKPIYPDPIIATQSGTHSNFSA